MKTYVNPVHLVTTKDGKCPEGHVEVQTLADGALTPNGTAILTLLTSDYRRRIVAALEAYKEPVDHLDGAEYIIDSCIGIIRNVELTKE